MLVLNGPPQPLLPMLRLRLFLGLLFLAGGCQPPGQPAIASAYGARTAPGLPDVVRPILDSSGTGIAMRPWSLRGYELTLHSTQAELFAADPSVVAVVGHPGSRDALLGAAVYNREGVPQVVPTGTSRALGRAGPWTFTLAPDDSVEGAFLANWAIDSTGARRIAVMYLGDEYGIGILEGVRGGLATRGMQLVDQVLLPSQSCGGTAAVNREVYSAIGRALIQRERPDVIILASANANGWCVTDLIHGTDPSIWILAADGFDVRQRSAGTRGVYAPDRLRGVSFWRRRNDDEASLEFVHRYSSATGRLPTAGDAMEYDAYMLLRAAILDVGPDREAIRAWLESLGRRRPAWPGVTGPVSFDRPRSGILRMVAPLDPAE